MPLSLATLTRLSWLELQGQIGRRTGYVIVALGYLIWFQQLNSQREDPYLLALVFVVASLQLWLSVASPAPLRPYIVHLQIAALWAGITIAYLALGVGEASLFFAAPVLLAAFGLGWRAGTMVAAVSLLLIAAGPMRGTVMATESIFLITMVAGLSGSASQALTQSLHESWRFNQDVSRLTGELRLRQEEVNRLNKALVTANGLLKRSLRELTLAQQEALDARRLKEEFATTVSHELRTPLNTILGFIEVMQRYPEVYGAVTWTTALRRDISEIQVSARYLSNLVDDILDLARIQALHMPLRREDTDLTSLIEEAATLAQRLLAGTTAVELRLSVPDVLPPINIDRVRIQQVLLNLLANACRFTEEGLILVEVALDREEVVISVSDTGPGIPAEELPHIFDDFHRTSGRPIGGAGGASSGLGLAIARRFVQMHGGRIWVESRHGEGSTFRFSLPLASKRVSLIQEPALPGPGASAPVSPSLVVIGDEHGLSFLARRLEGYELHSATGILEARSLVYNRHPDAVLVDIPLENGERAFGPAPRIIPEPVPVLSCSLPGSRHHVSDGLFSDWLVKPVDSDTLRQAIGTGSGASRVLVVDDDSSFGHLVQRYLQTLAQPPTVAYVRDGESALSVVQDFQPDLVLLDMALPGMDGWEVARSLQDVPLDPRPRLVAVTAMDPTQQLAGTAHTFSVTKSTGFSEAETLQLIRSCLAHLSPAYSHDSPVAES